MQTIIITVGISASGKSTYAKTLTLPENGNFIRLNRDEFRRSLIQTSLKTYWTGPKEHRNDVENMVTVMLNNALIYAVKQKRNVVVDNTHLSGKYINDILRICKAHCDKEGFRYTIKKFDVPLETCIARDNLREGDSVGEEVIEEQYRRLKTSRIKSKETAEYIPPVFPLINFDKSKTPCILCDIDGTVAYKADRSPFDWKRVGEDRPRQSVIDIVKRCIDEQTVLIFMSGRDAICRPETIEWLNKHFPNQPYHLYMRPHKDNRSDVDIKWEILSNNIAPHYFPLASFDDRDRVVKIIREMGITCFQVDYGNF